MLINHRHVGSGYLPYVIAELGVNHDGSVDRALELVDLAAEVGVDAVKLQLFRADLLMGRASRLAEYQIASGERDPVEMLRRLELTVHQMGPVVQRARARGLDAIVTVFSVELVPAAELLGWDAYKTASPDIVHRPLIEALAATGRPLIVSTGAAEPGEVQRAIGWLKGAQNRTALLQCVSCYPTAETDAEVGGVAALASLFGGPVGYSDHTRGVAAGVAAVRAGACVLEKHLTYDTSAAGPDHSASLDGPGMHAYCTAARQAWTDMQDDPGQDRKRQGIDRQAVKRVLPCERDVRTASRQSVTAARRMEEGHVVQRNDLTFKRPGTGLLPFQLDAVVGQTLRREVEADMPLCAEDFGWRTGLDNQDNQA